MSSAATFSWNNLNILFLILISLCQLVPDIFFLSSCLCLWWNPRNLLLIKTNGQICIIRVTILGQLFCICFRFPVHEFLWFKIRQNKRRLCSSTGRNILWFRKNSQNKLIYSGNKSKSSHIIVAVTMETNQPPAVETVVHVPTISLCCLQVCARTGRHGIPVSRWRMPERPCSRPTTGSEYHR